ncbi:MAG: hypothetical protein IJU79_03410 [Desulfovibrionaceae bacterium]|nr:hypothetical protein [Desulfovibrionaceae bacterium]
MLQQQQSNQGKLGTRLKVISKGHKKLVAATLFMCGLLGAAIVWVACGYSSGFVERIAMKLDSATAGTPLAGLGKLLRKEPVQPDRVLHPATNPGTLAGHVIRGESGLDGMLMPDGSFRAQGELVLKPVHEDSRLSRNFVEDVAKFIVTRYVPSEPHGQLLLELQQLNQHCSTRLNTEPGGGRQAILKYAFQPTMLKALYQLYISYFLDCLEQSSAETLTLVQQGELFNLLAKRFEDVNATLAHILSVKEFSVELSTFEASVEQYESLSAQLTLAQYDLEQLQALGDGVDPKELHTLSQRVAELTERLERAQFNRQENLHFFLDNLKRASAPDVDDDTLLFLAMWLHRRMQQQDNWRESCETCRELLGDLVARLRAQSSKIALTQEQKAPSNTLKAQGVDQLSPPPKPVETEEMMRATLVEDLTILTNQREAVRPTNTQDKQQEAGDPSYQDDDLPKPIQIPIKLK